MSKPEDLKNYALKTIDFLSTTENISLTEKVFVMISVSVQTLLTSGMSKDQCLFHVVDALKFGNENFDLQQKEQQQ